MECQSKQKLRAEEVPCWPCGTHTTSAMSGTGLATRKSPHGAESGETDGDGCILKL